MATDDQFRPKTDDAADSEKLASGIAQRKTGDPNAFETARGSDDRGSDKARGGEDTDSGDEEDKGGFLSKLKVPLIVSAIVLAVVGALLAVAKQSKEAEEKDVK